MISHHFEYRTKKATTPLTFVSINEAKEWKAEITAKFPEFAQTIKLYKVTVQITDEVVNDDESTSLSPTGTGNVVLEESTDSSDQGRIPEL